MKISKIILENYRQYADRQEIRFDNEESGKNVTVIIGENGEGKTNLLNAISWCLYGEEVRKKTKYEELPILTQIKNVERPSRIMVEITFNLDEEPSQKYEELILMREANIVEEDHITSTKFRGFLFSKENPNPLELSDPNVFVSQNIPRDLREFFLFDGEQLEKYFLSTVGETISRGIEKLAKIDLINESTRKLEQLKKDFVDEAAKTSPNIKQKEESIERIENRTTDDQAILTKKKNELEKSESELNKIQRKYEQMKAKDINKVIQERKTLEQKRKKLEERKISLEKNLGNQLLIDGPLFLISPGFNKLQKLVDEKEETGEFPPDIKDIFVESLLERGECICSQDLKGENNIYRQNVEELLKKLTKQDFIRLAQLKYREIIRIQSKIETLPVNLKDLKRNIVRDKEEISRIDYRLKEISEILKENPEEIVRALEITRSNLKNRLKELQREIWTIEQQVISSQQEKEKLERELNAEIAKEKRNELIKKKIDFCSDTLNILKITKVKIEQETMERVNKKMKDYFEKFHWKEKEAFGYIYFEKEKGISIKKEGMEALGSLSTGEQNFLALAFITAIRETSNFNLPVVIDSPFGRIGEAGRENISKYLPEYLANSQITILATPSEYTGAVKKELNRYISKIIRLSYDKKHGTTKIPSLEEI